MMEGKKKQNLREKSIVDVVRLILQDDGKKKETLLRNRI